MADKPFAGQWGLILGASSGFGVEPRMNDSGVPPAGMPRDFPLFFEEQNFPAGAPVGELSRHGAADDPAADNDGVVDQWKRAGLILGRLFRGAEGTTLRRLGRRGGCRRDIQRPA